MDPDSEIAGEFNVLRMYKSGRIEVLINDDDVPAGTDPHTGVMSKDVVIDSEANITARLFIPNLVNLGEQQKLPVVVHYHGGGFCVFSPTSLFLNQLLNNFVAKANVVVVSVAYRLVPKHPLPIAYDDSFVALKWVFSNAEEEEWLKKYGDINRVFLYGESAGANITHNLAMRAEGMGVKGVACVHPWFWIPEPVENEKRDEEASKLVEFYWKIICPKTIGLDDPLINPLAVGAPSLTGLACEKLLVIVAEHDQLKFNGIGYYEGVKKSGWTGKLELLENEGEDHIFYAFNPSSEKALAFFEHLGAFFNE